MCEVSKTLKVWGIGKGFWERWDILVIFKEISFNDQNPHTLRHHNSYKLLTHNPTNAKAHDARTLMHYMHSQYIIDMTTMKFLLPPKNTCTPLFYGLPKINKLNCSLYRIVSECDPPTHRLSSYITHSVLQGITPTLKY